LRKYGEDPNETLIAEFAMSVRLRQTRRVSTMAGIALSLAALGLVASSGAAAARDINLGGHRAEQLQSTAPNEVMSKLPDDALAIPRVVVSVQNRETGRWQRVLVDAYFQSANHHALSQVRDRMKEIVAKAGPRLSDSPAEFLGSAHSGMRTAKDCLRLAAEETLGHSLDGDIFIRSLAVF
jgi:hypothetical protein